jgi:hypothetical protein
MLSEATPTKEQVAAWKRDGRRAKARNEALDLAVLARLAAQAELRRASAYAVQEAWPQDVEVLTHILWKSLSKCAETTLDAIAGAKLKSLASKFSVRRYVHWLRCTCIAAILEEVCSGPALWNSAKHIVDTIGETSWPTAYQTRRMLARLMTEMLGGTHVDNLQDRVRPVLEARIDHWEAAAIGKLSEFREASPPKPVGQTSKKLRSERGKPTIAAPNQIRDWADLEIRFVSDDRVQIIAGDHSETRNYAEFGFEDGRSKGRTAAWAALQFLARSDGTVKAAPNGHDWKTFERRVMEIRKRFKAHFRLHEDPLPFDDGYRARFKISCAPSINC